MLKKLSELLLVALALVALATSAATAMPKTMATEATPVRSGTVIETMNAAGYTYLLVAEPGGERWVAIPETTVATGSSISYYDGMVMTDFTSTSLARTFPAIVFSAGLAEQTATVPNASAPADSAEQNPDDSFAAAIMAERGTLSPAPLPEISGGSIAAVVPFTEVAIEKAPAANGYTVAEIFAQVDALAGEKVQIRGKVVKFSPMIMGRNWIHLQDGSGNPMQNTHDLVITSEATVEVDSVVTLEGILAANRDFGAGYTYQAIVESAAVVE